MDEPGTGLVAFGSFGFSDEPGDSVLTVPEIVVGRRGGHTWLTTASRGGLDLLDRRGPIAVADPPQPPGQVSFGDGALNGEQWMAVVADAVARINAGELEKVVLARDLVATADRAARRPLAAGPADAGLPDLLDVPRRRASSAPRRSCWSAGSAAWSRHGCWPAPSGVPATTRAT